MRPAESWEAPVFTEDSPSNKLSNVQLKARSGSTLDGSSSQSLSLSKVIKYAKYKESLTVGSSGIHKEISFSNDDRRTGILYQNLGGNEKKLTKKVITDPAISTYRSTNGRKGNHDKDRNFKQGVGLEEDRADCKGKFMGFSKPVPRWSNLPSTKKAPGWGESKKNKEVSTIEHTSGAPSKQVKICWWWRKGRCHRGDKCWFAHNITDMNKNKESSRWHGKSRRGRTQLNNENARNKPGNNRSPKEREREKRSHRWTAREVKGLARKATWRLGRELNLEWPANAKEEVVSKLIIDRLKESGRLCTGFQSHIGPPKIVCMKIPKNKKSLVTGSALGRGAGNGNRLVD